MINRVNELAAPEPEFADLVHTAHLKQSGMLVVPVILLQDGMVVDHLGHPVSKMDCSFADPVKMARLWRVQNAAVIHIIDRSSTLFGGQIDFESIDRITRCLDIPIQLEARFDQTSAAAALKQSRVARLAPSLLSVGDDTFLSVVDQFGPNKICPILAHHTADVNDTDSREDEILSQLAERIDFVTQAGCRRVIIRDERAHHNLSGHHTRILATLASKYPRIRFSAAGGIGSYRDLKSLEIESPDNVDSVIINRALYENRFPCQKMWCWHSKDQVDLQKFSSAKLKT